VRVQMLGCRLVVEDDGSKQVAAVPPETIVDSAAVPVLPSRELLIGERLAHFRIEERLGHGGMGIVYRGRDEKLGRDVALKVLPPDVVARPDRRERFLREARAAAAVVHPAIATIFEVGTARDVPFIAMELIRGRTLRDLPRSPPPTVAEIVPIAIAEGLSRAHKAGVVHRDLKPENVMLDADGAPKILDFGVARVVDSEAETRTSDHGRDTHMTSQGTPTGAVVGTPLYMSPEQARGLQVDGRSDLFSFGPMLFELLCGRPPLTGHLPRPTQYGRSTWHRARPPSRSPTRR
jgi:serine/threonine protein kinase